MIKVTVYISTYNYAQYIKKAINSVIAQTMTNWELIVIDDGSIDSGPNIVKKISNIDNRIKLLHTQGRLGPGSARNEGIKIAKGKYISFLDSDDVWLQNKLDIQVDFMEKEKLDFSFTSYKKINTDDKIISDVIPVPEKVNLSGLLKTNYIGTLTTMYNVKSLGKMYMNSFALQEDYGLWIDIIKKTKKVASLSQVLSLYRVHSSNISRNKFRSFVYQWKIYREHVNLGILKSIYYLIHYTYFGYKKYRT